ncbi:rhamnulose-1-phosphate aldolase [Eggerthellaceae bacterium 3-80]|nr:rhamnulose-1-phosphate aldolase [bacterium D16-34]
MGFLDDAQDFLDKGVSAAKGAVSNVAVEQFGYMKAFARLCADGAQAGWHEGNGGNLSYRLTEEEVANTRSYFYTTPSSWVTMDRAFTNLAGEYFAITSAGCSMKNVALDQKRFVGIIELDSSGGAWRVVWGFKDGGQPTSELLSHLECHSVRKRVTGGVSRVVYHAHPTSVIALSKLTGPDAGRLSNELWRAMTECVLFFPEGVGAVPTSVPGSDELASQTTQAMEEFAAVVWVNHGLLSTGAGFDEVFGLESVIVKAADIICATAALVGAHTQASFALTGADIRAIAEQYHLPLRADFVEE